MKPALFLLFFICLLPSYLQAQKTHLTHNIGNVNANYTYGKFLRKLGKPDSIFVYDPTIIKPIPKDLVYHKLFYDDNNFVVTYMHFMYWPFKRSTEGPDIEIYNGSQILLNGDAIGDLDSTAVIKKYGIPKNIHHNYAGYSISYNFTRGKYFNLMIFYFRPDGIINKVWLLFGKY